MGCICSSCPLNSSPPTNLKIPKQGSTPSLMRFKPDSVNCFRPFWPQTTAPNWTKFSIATLIASWLGAWGPNSTQPHTSTVSILTKETPYPTGLQATNIAETTIYLPKAKSLCILAQLPFKDNDSLCRYLDSKIVTSGSLGEADNAGKTLISLITQFIQIYHAFPFVIYYIGFPFLCFLLLLCFL